MLRRIRDQEGWTVAARDGDDVGTVRDFYFDDQRWTVRYLVLETGDWFTGQYILTSPMAIDAMDWQNARVRLNLTRDRVENAPPVRFDHPITRGYESAYSAYYGYPIYWAGPALWGPAASPYMIPSPAAPASLTDEQRRPEDDEQHVRSVKEVSGYHIAATDGEIGHVEDFLFDDETWSIRYLVVDTSNWIGGRTILLPPDWVSRVDWPQRRVYVDVSREAVRRSPDYNGNGAAPQTGE